jgi:hypothetical protein
MQSPLSAVSFDLARLHRRTVTSFYSNLVTRPTGRAVRLGLEQQLTAVAGPSGACLSILDFSQVRIMDYSCADEIVAKLLVRYRTSDRPLDAYFVARGLQEHHLEAVSAVLERHQLLLMAEQGEGPPLLLGPCSPIEHAVWAWLAARGAAGPEEVSLRDEQPLPAIRAAFERFIQGRVAIPVGPERVAPLPLSRD